MAETQSDKQNTGKHVIESVEATKDKIGGRIEMSAEVVATVAGLAARNIPGIHSLGKSRLVSFGDDPKRGIEVEVGSKEAALDLEVIIEYGCDLRKVADQLRKKVADEVNQMAGRDVIEVNLDVVGVHLPEEEGEEKAEPATRRVR